MFRRSPQHLNDVLNILMRQEGLEIPLLEKRAVDAWDTVTGSIVARNTTEKYLRNQVLFVKISNPALRQDLNMMKSEIIKKLNEKVGAFVIADIKIN